MCIIVDSNMLGRVFPKKKPRDEDMQPVWDWLQNKNGKIVYSNSDKFTQEYGKAKIREMEKLKEAGQAKLVSKGVAEKEKELEDRIQSDDPHILALALVARVKVLISSDKTLHADFTNPVLIRHGKVYQNKEHARLLTADLCS